MEVLSVDSLVLLCCLLLVAFLIFRWAALSPYRSRVLRFNLTVLSLYTMPLLYELLKSGTGYFGLFLYCTLLSAFGVHAIVAAIGRAILLTKAENRLSNNRSPK